MTASRADAAKRPAIKRSGRKIVSPTLFLRVATAMACEAVATVTDFFAGEASKKN
jgi:hypothetical protein